MAFSESNKLKICRILRINGLEFDRIIVYRGSLITAQVETDVISEITRWDAGIGTDFVYIQSSANNPVKIDPEEEKRDIRRNIAVMLFSEYLVGASDDGFEIVRG